MHRAQLATIPFENFDILLGRSILLSPESLVDKLIARPRGGYCFELNGLFAHGCHAILVLAGLHAGIAAGIAAGRLAQRESPPLFGGPRADG